MKKSFTHQGLTLRPLAGLALLLLVASLAAGCLPDPPSGVSGPGSTPAAVRAAPTTKITPLPTRPVYQPGELVDYTAQTGDTLTALAARFNTSVQEIRAANPIIPLTATTMPPGMPMKIPIYYRPLWGSAFQIIPDSLFINGPAQVGFNTSAFVDAQPGWLKNYSEYVGDQNRRGGEIIDYVSTNYSVSPRLLLAIAEYQTGALSDPNPPDASDTYMLGKIDFRKEGFYRQIAWAADTLNYAYYFWRSGKLLSFEHLDSRLERPDPWQNAATTALQYYFSRVIDGDEFDRAISGEGLTKTYTKLFGDPWVNVKPHIPGSLEQPPLRLPFEPNLWWAFTGGPHNAWGDQPSTLAAVDFAPPSLVGGCKPSEQWAAAMADGVVARTGTGIVVLDLDGDGDERTGWVIFYLHLETGTTPPVGTHLKAGERIGKPSCEGGEATGTHVHIARKYNGEWMLAEGALALNLEGWVARNGAAPYQGTLFRNGHTISACVCSDQASQLDSTAAPLKP
ncbi:MAG TPA: LysM peptidoglycan-binding domain-containing protein [Anaerolineaceae bacterium]